MEQITEEMGIHKKWYEEAKKVNPETIGEFVRHLVQDFGHDYGTICHACAAAAVAGATAVDHSPSGGITGFQAGAIMWEFIRAWGVMEDGPKKMLCYGKMLYPQYEEKFDKIISKAIWEYLQTEAKKKLTESSTVGVHPDVLTHWESVAAGQVPFGYRVEVQS